METGPDLACAGFNIVPLSVQEDIYPLPVV
jgi:hypothetical protein